MNLMTAEDILFFAFAIVSTISALMVVLMANPVYSALFLALTMSILGALFFTLQGYFVSVAQITVYAGAVMVLFVMVLMLFDLRREHEDVFKLSPINVAKIGAATLACAFLVAAGWLAVGASTENPATQVAPGVTQKDLTKGDQGLPSKTAKPESGEQQPGGPVTTTQPGAEAKTLTQGQAQDQGQVAQATNNPQGSQPSQTSPTTVAGTVSAQAQGQAQAQTGAAPGSTTNPDEDLTNAEAKKLVEQAQPKDQNAGGAITPEEFGSTVSLSERLFSKYVFAFEAVSLLLLVAIVGAVALARSRGGTHHVAR